MINKKALLSAAISTLTITSSTYAADTPAPSNIDALADTYVAAYVKQFPSRLIEFGTPEAEYDRLDDNSLDALSRWYAQQDAIATQLKNLSTENLWGTPDWITYGFLKEALDSGQQSRVCKFELWQGVNHMFGWHLSAGQSIEITPVDTGEMRAYALTRWGGLSASVDIEIANLRKGLNAGYSSPKMIVSAVITQIDSLLASAPKDTPYNAPAKKQVPDAFKANWAKLLTNSFIPALKKYRDFLASEYLPRARDAVSITSNPNGAECYKASYRSFTTLPRTAEEVFAIGEKAANANKAKIRALGQQLFGISDEKALLDKVANDIKNRFKTRDQVLADTQKLVTRSRDYLRPYFGLYPKQDVELKVIPPHEEKFLTASYRNAPKDGSRPAYYMINLYNPTEISISSNEVTAYHEGYPGHHLQIGVAQELPDTHMITQLSWNSGYVEGWARYSEALSEEVGLFQSSHARIGRLSWPARGMVADAGIHGKGWTNDQAISFMAAGGTMTRNHAASLLRRIAIIPGQLASYDTGGLLIMALRKQAEAALGDKFDIKIFHDKILDTGSVTLPMLEEKIDKWIETDK